MAILLRYWWVFALGLLAFGVYLMVENYNEAQREAARSAAQVEEAGRTLNQVEQASEANNEIRRTDNTVLYCQCVRSSRDGPANCQRFLPAGYSDSGQPAPKCEAGTSRPR